MHDDIKVLIALISRLPGVGRRSAERVALHLLCDKETELRPFIAGLQRAAEALRACSICGNLDGGDPCAVCACESRRASGQVCVVERVSDLWAAERSGSFRGCYHVLGGTLSAMEGRTAEKLRVPELVRRVKDEQIKEVIVATGGTLEGHTTAHYIAQALAGTGVHVTRPAQGIPAGGELHYLDEGTIAAAMRSRRGIAQA